MGRRGPLARRRRDGSIEVQLEDVERQVLGDVLGQLRDALVSDTDAPVLARLFPPAYADDAEKEAGFRVLARGELLESRLAALDLVESSLAAPPPLRLGEEGASAWLRVLNDVRLVLGVRLDVSEDEPHGPASEDDPDALAWALYELLSHVVDDLVTALAAGLE